MTYEKATKVFKSEGNVLRRKMIDQGHQTQVEAILRDMAAKPMLNMVQARFFTGMTQYRLELLASTKMVATAMVGLRMVFITRSLTHAKAPRVA